MPSRIPPLPNATIVHAYLARGMRLWVSARLLATAVFLLGGGNPLPMWTSGSPGFVAAVALLAYVDMNLRKERAFIANLGIPTAVIVFVCAAPAVAGELLVTVIGRLP